MFYNRDVSCDIFVLAEGWKMAPSEDSLKRTHPLSDHQGIGQPRQSVGAGKQAKGCSTVTEDGAAEKGTHHCIVLVVMNVLTK